MGAVVMVKVTPKINAMTLIKGRERYVFIYDDSSVHGTLQALGRFASNPELSFSWSDAAVMSQEIRKQAEGVR